MCVCVTRSEPRQVSTQRNLIRRHSFNQALLEARHNSWTLSLSLSEKKAEIY